MSEILVLAVTQLSVTTVLASCVLLTHGVRRYSLAGDSLSRRRDLELHGPSGARIVIVSPRLVIPGGATRFRLITIGILQILPADARLWPRRALFPFLARRALRVPTEMRNS
jgi:hypothetical protein